MPDDVAAHGGTVRARAGDASDGHTRAAVSSRPAQESAGRRAHAAAGYEPYPELLAYRSEFPILARKTYLNSCSLGALSLRAMEGMARFQGLWNEYGAAAWYSLWMGELAALRAKFARLIGAQPHEVAIAPNVSVALGEIASGLDLGARTEVLMAAMDFPTLAYQWLARRRIGIDVAFVESPDGITLPAERFQAQLSARTGLVATSHVFYLSGYIQDIGTLAAAAHAQGALLLVDDYQGTGQIPLDVKALDLDFLVTGTLKWLMGGPGVALIYVREELIPRLLPTVSGWWAARDQFAFDTRSFAFREDAARLEAGTPPMGAVYAASAAMDIVLEIGVERIRARTRYLADDLVRRAREHGWTLRSPENGAERSSIVILALERPEELVAALAERGIIVDSRPGLLRISPHFYNTVDENQLIVAALAELLGRRG